MKTIESLVQTVECGGVTPRREINHYLANICRNAALSDKGSVNGIVDGRTVVARRIGPRLSLAITVEMIVDGVVKTFFPENGKWYLR
jgi:hypothetical protein